MVENYKKISYKCVGIWVVAAIISVSIAVFAKINLYVGVICFYIINEIVIGYARKELFLARNQIQEKYKKDWDIEYAGETYERILASKCLLERSSLLYDYLLLLLNTCQFEKFADVYKENRKNIRNLFMWKHLRLLIIYTSSLLKDKREYRTRLSKYRFLKWHKKKGKLSEIKACRRVQDNTIKILQLYENGEYHSVITKIEQMDIVCSWDELYFHSIKERCLFHMNKKHSIPKQEQTKFLFVKQWDVLVRTGEEYHDDRACELLKVMYEDMKFSYVKFVMVSVAMVLVFFFIV